MRLSIPLLGAVAAGLLVACSNPDSGSRSAGDSRFEAELELAIVPVTDVEQLVISDAEILRPEPSPQRTPTRSTPAPAPAQAEQPVPDIVAHVHPASRTPAAPEVDAVPVVLTGAGRAGAEQARRPGSGIQVIIRGGVDPWDPCAVHGPGAADVIGPIGVLINNPAPRDVGTGAYTGPSGSRGAIGLRGGGGIFAGGIR